MFLLVDFNKKIERICTQHFQEMILGISEERVSVARSRLTPIWKALLVNDPISKALICQSR